MTEISAMVKYFQVPKVLKYLRYLSPIFGRRPLELGPKYLPNHTLFKRIVRGKVP